MNKIVKTLFSCVAVGFLCTGCVQMTYTKSVTVHKDAQGVITGSDEYESITEPHSEMKKIKSVDGDLSFKHLH